MKLPTALPALLLLAACSHPNTAGVTPTERVPTRACAGAPLATLPYLHTARVPTIEASIAGQPVRAELSGDSNLTVVLQTAAQRRHLTTRTVPAPALLPDAGPVPVTVVDIPQIAIGQARLPQLKARQFAHMPYGRYSGAELALAMATLGGYAFDFDAPHDRFSLYRGSTCSGAAQPFGGRTAAIDMRPDPHNRVVIPVSLNGATRSATLDPAAPFVLITARAAAALPPPGATVVRGPDGAVTARIWVQRFNELRIGPDRLRNIRLVVVDGLPVSGDMLIGAPYLKHRRALISMPDRKVYIEVPARGAPPPGATVTRPERR
jgi:hypothetical protein